MTATWIEPLPPIARLGFDDGWLLLGPTFLNFKLPAIVVDHRLVGPTGFGLETFADRTPGDPWSRSTIDVLRCGGQIALRSPQIGSFASHWFDRSAYVLNGFKKLILIIGDTHALELSWSELWECSIGIAELIVGEG